MSEQKSQRINCTVDSCRYHEHHDLCRLSSIQASPLKDDAQSAKDSMCQNFMRKD